MIVALGTVVALMILSGCAGRMGDLVEHIIAPEHGFNVSKNQTLERDLARELKPAYTSVVLENRAVEPVSTLIEFDLETEVDIYRPGLTRRKTVHIRTDIEPCSEARVELPKMRTYKVKVGPLGKRHTQAIPFSTEGLIRPIVDVTPHGVMRAQPSLFHPTELRPTTVHFSNPWSYTATISWNERGDYTRLPETTREDERNIWVERRIVEAVTTREVCVPGGSVTTVEFQPGAYRLELSSEGRPFAKWHIQVNGDGKLYDGRGERQIFSPLELPPPGPNSVSQSAVRIPNPYSR